MTKEEKDYCEICSIYDVCGYANRGLQRKCKRMKTFVDGFDAAVGKAKEKQGEQKPYGQRKECEDCQFNYAGECKGYCALKRNESKPTGKFEPKFNVGDWIISNDGTHTYLVKERKRGIYVLLDIGDDEEFSIVIETADKTGRLWSIYDAKDGDVLVASDGSIFLFAGVDDCACKYYVALTTDNYVKINKEAKGGYWETSRAVHPATKEQRDLLSQKMADAGTNL